MMAGEAMTPLSLDDLPVKKWRVFHGLCQFTRRYQTQNLQKRGCSVVVSHPFFLWVMITTRPSRLVLRGSCVISEKRTASSILHDVQNLFAISLSNGWLIGIPAIGYDNPEVHIPSYSQMW